MKSHGDPGCPGGPWWSTWWSTSPGAGWRVQGGGWSAHWGASGEGSSSALSSQPSKVHLLLLLHLQLRQVVKLEEFGESWRTIFSYSNEASPSLKGLKAMFPPVFRLFCTLVQIQQWSFCNYISYFIHIYVSITTILYCEICNTCMKCAFGFAVKTMQYGGIWVR